MFVIPNSPPQVTEHTNIEPNAHKGHIRCHWINNLVGITVTAIVLQWMAGLKTLGAKRLGIIWDKVIIELVSFFNVSCCRIIKVLFVHIRIKHTDLTVNRPKLLLFLRRCLCNCCRNVFQISFLPCGLSSDRGRRSVHPIA